MIDIKKETAGRWPSLLPLLGVDKKFLSNRHGPCPLCGGRDRFRFDDKGRGMWFCSQCGPGDGFKLVMLANSYSFKEAARAVENHLGLSSVTRVRSGPTEAAVRTAINTMWLEGLPLREMLPTSSWWMRRAGSVPTFKDLRAARNLVVGRDSYPGMIALVRGVDGKAVNLHRTFMRNDGHKAPMDDVRRVMPLNLPDGCAVRMGEPLNGVLGIAEGIETAYSCAAMFGVPVWAALNAQNLKKWTPPEGVSKVMIFGDNDESWTGQEAAYSLAKKLHAAKITVEVHMPPDVGSDWNDVHMLTLGEMAA